jgi:hypothetical protein
LFNRCLQLRRVIVAGRLIYEEQDPGDFQ